MGKLKSNSARIRLLVRLLGRETFICRRAEVDKILPCVLALPLTFESALQSEVLPLAVYPAKHASRTAKGIDDFWINYREHQFAAISPERGHIFCLEVNGVGFR